MRIHNDFIDLRLNLVQANFQRLCVLEFAVRLGFLNEGLQKGLLLKQGLQDMRKFGVGIDDRAIDRCSLRGCWFGRLRQRLLLLWVNRIQLMHHSYYSLVTGTCAFVRRY